jgi:hypothetical protein
LRDKNARLELALRISDAALSKLKSNGQKRLSKKFGQVLKWEQGNLKLQQRRVQQTACWIEGLDIWDDRKVLNIEWSKDEDLLAAILADLEASIFEGERYRKVWARLRVQQGIRVEELKKTFHVHSRRPQGARRSRRPSRSDGELPQSRLSAYR